MKYLRNTMLLSAAMFAILTVVFAPLAGAVDITSGVCKATAEQPAVCKDADAGRASNPLLGKDGIVTTGIKIFILAVGVISIFVMVINGTKMITSNGDANSVSKARNGIIYAVIGLVIALSAQVIVATVINKLN